MGRGIAAFFIGLLVTFSIFLLIWLGIGQGSGTALPGVLLVFVALLLGALVAPELYAHRPRTPAGWKRLRASALVAALLVLVVIVPVLAVVAPEAAVVFGAVGALILMVAALLWMIRQRPRSLGGWLRTLALAAALPLALVCAAGAELVRTLPQAQPYLETGAYVLLTLGALVCGGVPLFMAMLVPAGIVAEIVRRASRRGTGAPDDLNTHPGKYMVMGDDGQMERVGKRRMRRMRRAAQARGESLVVLDAPPLSADDAPPTMRRR